jgi:hypothetical protein
MSGYEPEPDRVWDEYEWERFLQQQDHKTEKYMELLEKYLDHPQRDQIIAREMGWNHLLDQEGQDWAEHVDSQFEAEAMAAGVAHDEDEEGSDSAGDPDSAEGFGFEVHPLYRSAFMLAAWVDEMFEEAGEQVSSHPAGLKLAGQTAMASAKLAAALSDDDIDEIGMTIAYLKRALRAVTTGLECAVELRDARALNNERFGGLNQQLFHVRDGIIQLMGEYRAEWRRRFET